MPKQLAEMENFHSVCNTQTTNDPTKNVSILFVLLALSAFGVHFHIRIHLAYAKSQHCYLQCERVIVESTFIYMCVFAIATCTVAEFAAAQQRRTRVKSTQSKAEQIAKKIKKVMLHTCTPPCPFVLLYGFCYVTHVMADNPPHNRMDFISIFNWHTSHSIASHFQSEYDDV